MKRDPPYKPLGPVMDLSDKYNGRGYHLSTFGSGKLTKQTDPEEAPVIILSLCSCGQQL